MTYQAQIVVGIFCIVLGFICFILAQSWPHISGAISKFGIGTLILGAGVLLQQVLSNEVAVVVFVTTLCIWAITAAGLLYQMIFRSSDE